MIVYRKHFQYTEEFYKKSRSIKMSHIIYIVLGLVIFVPSDHSHLLK